MEQRAEKKKQGGKKPSTSLQQKTSYVSINTHEKNRGWRGVVVWRVSEEGGRDRGNGRGEDVFPIRLVITTHTTANQTKPNPNPNPNPNPVDLAIVILLTLRYIYIYIIH